MAGWRWCVPARRVGAAMTPADASMVSGEDWSAAVLAIARTRDRGAFERLFRHFAPRIKSLALRGGLAPVAAEEIAQEAMLNVWRKAALFDASRASAATWIFTIARNLRTDALRRAGRGPAMAAGDDDATLLNALPDGAPLADELVAGAQRDAAIRDALARLPAEQAAIIRLSFYEGKPHGAIAAQLALPLGTVKSRSRLALSRLRKALETAR